MHLTIVLGLLASLAPSLAHADGVAVEERTEPKQYIPLAFGLPQLGFGMVTRAHNEMDLGTRAFDGTARWSPGKAVLPQLRIGGFVEARTAGFDTLEWGIGPAVQYSFTEFWAIQARGGLASALDGPGYALAGVQVGNPLLGLTVTGRRFFEDKHLELSVNLEVSTIVLGLGSLLGDLSAGTNR